MPAGHSGQRLSLRPVSVRRPVQLVLTVLLGILLTGSATYAQTGAALDFDGSDDFVSIGNTIPTLTTFTLEAWVKPAAGYGSFPATSDPVEVISRWGAGGAGNAAYRLGINSNGTLVGAVFSQSAGGSSVVTSTSVIATNTWTHIAFTRSVDNTLRLYINGVLAGTTTGSIVPQASNYAIQFGRPLAGSNVYKGSIDEVRIWNRALIACEITNQRNCELAAGQTGLVAYYQFNQGNGTSLSDLSGNNYTGTLNEFALTGITSNWVVTGGVQSGNSCAAPVAITANPSLTIANGNSTTLTASGANSYIWSTNATSATMNASPTTTTTYSVTGTTANGCSLASTTVTVASALTVAVTASLTNVCAGNTVSLTGTVSGGTTPYSYSWVAPAGVTINGSGSAVTASASTTLSGPQALTLKVSDGLNAPVASQTLVINAISSLIVSVSGNLNVPVGTSTTLTASGANSYTWSTGVSTTTITPTVNIATVYSVTGNTSGCTGTASVTALPFVTVNCNTYATRTITNGLGDNVVNDVFAAGNRVYAATNKGLSISTDGGKTFTNQALNGGVAVSKVYADGNKVYCAFIGKIAYSTDGGQNFSLVQVAPDFGISSLFVTGNTVITPSGSSGRYGISTDGGQTFTVKTIDALQRTGGRLTSVFGVNGNIYMTATAAIPKATNQGIYISTNGGESVSGNAAIALTLITKAVYATNSAIYIATTAGLYVSTNGGTSFSIRTKTNGLGSNSVNDVFAIDNRVYAATDNGLSVSTDGGANFVNYTTAHGLAAAKINAVHVEGTTVYAATAAGLSVSDFAVLVTTPGNTIQAISSVNATPGQSITLTATPNTGYLWNQNNANTQSIVVTTSGTYSVTATGNCPGTGSVAVTYLQPTSTTAQQVTKAPDGTAKVVISIPKSTNKALPAPPSTTMVKIAGPNYAQTIKIPASTQPKATIPPPTFPTSFTVKATSITTPGSYTVEIRDSKTKKLISYQVFNY